MICKLLNKFDKIYFNDHNYNSQVFSEQTTNSLDIPLYTSLQQISMCGVMPVCLSLLQFCVHLIDG
jgi:hypothetical protein